MLKALYQACQDKNTYSVIEICPKLGVSYELVKAWSIHNEIFETVLSTCHSMCCTNAEIAALMGRLPLEETINARYRLKPVFSLILEVTKNGKWWSESDDLSHFRIDEETIFAMRHLLNYV